MEAWLVAIHRGPTGQAWQLPAEGQAVIGRVSDAEVQLDDATVGRRHARIHRRLTGDVFRYGGSASGASVDELECTLADMPLHDGAELRIGSVYLRYFCGPGAAERVQREVAQLAAIDSLTGLPLGDPPGAARLAVADIASLRARHGFIAIDQLLRKLGRRLATLAAGDADLRWTRDECFAVDPPVVARRLVVEASLEPIYCDGEPMGFELVIE